MIDEFLSRIFISQQPLIDLLETMKLPPP